jgi:hypothetical protein
MDAAKSISLHNLLLLCPLFLLLTSCTTWAQPENPPPNTPTPIIVEEKEVIEIPLRGPLSRRRAQLSGLAWYRNNLILLPQYPDRYENQLFYLNKLEIISVLRGEITEPLRPRPITVVMDELLAQLPGYQGFEAIAIEGDRVFLTVEAKVDDQMIGYLVTGNITSDLSEVRFDPALVSTISPQTALNNLADESVFVVDNQVVTLYEVNGAPVNLAPAAHVFHADDLQLVKTIPFPGIDYRITDATPVDKEGRFWAINNYSLPNRPVRLGTEPLAAKYGVGPTHQLSQAVERLVEFQYSPDGITLVDAPPVQLQLQEDAARNWEGIVRFEGEEFSGFILATDRQPRTILAFVPHALPQPGLD